MKFYNDFTTQICDGDEWIQPVFKGIKGHPIIFRINVADKILNCEADKSLRDINKSIANKKYWNCNYPEVLDDIDTKSDYNKIITKN